MATISELVEKDILTPIEVQLDDHEFHVRKLYMMTAAFEALLNDLDAEDDPVWANQQADAFFHAFITGAPFHFDKPLPAFKPLLDAQKNPTGIWEYKSETLRFFGCFPAKDVFIIARCVPKKVLLYSNYNNAIRKSGIEFANVDLKLTDCIQGGAINAVLSGAT